MNPELAWFQLFKLKSDDMLTILVFNLNLRHYVAVIAPQLAEVLTQRAEQKATDAAAGTATQ